MVISQEYLYAHIRTETRCEQLILSANSVKTLVGGLAGIQAGDSRLVLNQLNYMCLGGSVRKIQGKISIL